MRNPRLRREPRARNKLVILTEGDVIEIRKLYLEGFSSRDLAIIFPVSQSQISRIVNRRHWNFVN